MTDLDSRDRRRARKIAQHGRTEHATYQDLIPLIAAALKREREETIDACPRPHICSCGLCKAQRGFKAEAKARGGTR